MSREKEMIEIINQQMPKSSAQLNKLFESDAEILDFHGRKIVYNMDEFSEEDLLREEDAYTLGWNMTVGSISDILASGGTAKFFAHSLVVKNSWSKEYVEKLSMGIADVLRQSETSFIGGDFGVSEIWRYTGSVIGELNGASMLRSGAKVGDVIFITGKIGLGNVEAALKLYSDNTILKSITNHFKNRFRLRNKEALFIKEYSRCCIDTSDGVYQALKTISSLSKTGFEVYNLPYENSGLLLAKLLNIPKELLFLAECGEYELLFTIDKELKEAFVKKAEEKGLTFYQLGKIQDIYTQYLYESEWKLDLSTYDIAARDYQQPKNYLTDVIEFVKTRRTR